MSLRLLALASCALLAGCGPAAAPAPADAPPAATPPSPAVSPPPVTLPAPRPAREPTAPRPAREPPLTQEELDLIAADVAALSPDMRRKRAFALRRKILQNPDSPTARQLESLRLAAENGELQPQLAHTPAP